MSVNPMAKKILIFKNLERWGWFLLPPSDLIITIINLIYRSNRVKSRKFSISKIPNKPSIWKNLEEFIESKFILWSKVFQSQSVWFVLVKVSHKMQLSIWSSSFIIKKFKSADYLFLSCIDIDHLRRKLQMGNLLINF